MHGRRQFLVGLGGGLGAATMPVQARSLHTQGRLTATEEEASEGYFSIGQNIQVVARQGSEEHTALQAMVGQEVNISVF